MNKADLDAMLLLLEEHGEIRRSLRVLLAPEAGETPYRSIATHDTSPRVLLDSEVEKLRGLCASKDYLYWWDMGSMIATLDAAIARAEKAQADVARWAEADALFDKTVGQSLRRAAEILGQGNWDNIDHAAERVVRERDELIAAAAAAIPEAEHPAEPTPHNWAWQIRVLGDDRRAAYKQRDEAREKVREEIAATVERWGYPKAMANAIRLGAAEPPPPLTPEEIAYGQKVAERLAASRAPAEGGDPICKGCGRYASNSTGMCRECNEVAPASPPATARETGATFTARRAAVLSGVAAREAEAEAIDRAGIKARFGSIDEQREAEAFLAAREHAPPGSVWCILDRDRPIASGGGPLSLAYVSHEEAAERVRTVRRGSVAGPYVLAASMQTDEERARAFEEFNDGSGTVKLSQNDRVRLAREFATVRAESVARVREAREATWREAMRLVDLEHDEVIGTADESDDDVKFIRAFNKGVDASLRALAEKGVQS